MGQICLSEWDSIVHMAGRPLEFKEGSLHCLMEHCRCHAKSKRIAWDSYRLSSRMKTIWFQITFVNFDMPTDALQVYQQEIVCVRALPSLSSMYWSGYRSFLLQYCLLCRNPHRVVICHPSTVQGQRVLPRVSSMTE